MKRVTGLGGVFFKSSNQKNLVEWYREHLGIDAADWGGTSFKWREEKNLYQVGYTVWCAFKNESSKFDPSDKPYMINYRVDDLVGLLAALKKEGVEIVGEMVEDVNGKFAWIVDPEGTKIELWEPVPSHKDPYLNG